MDTVILNARVAPETKEKLGEIVERIRKENNLKTAGEAYTHIAEILEQEQKKIAPVLTEQVTNIKTNLTAIYSSVTSMNDVFRAYEENQNKIKEEEQEALVEQINTLHKENEELKNIHLKDQKRIKELEKEQDELKKELETYKNRIKQQSQIDELLDSVNLLINKKDVSKKNENKEEQLPGQVGLDHFLDEH